MVNLENLTLMLNNYVGMEQEDVEEFLEEELDNINNIIDISVEERVFVSNNFQIRLKYEKLDPLDDYNNHLILKKFKIESI